MAVRNPVMQRMLSERRSPLGLPVRDPQESDPTRQQPSNPTNYFENIIEGRTYKGIVDPFKGLSPFPSRCSHQVFPSFCGVDVRKAFLPHMLKEFKNKGITVFTDNKDIKRSMSIGPELKEAIKGSRVSIVIVSKNYASSTWCLDELVLIIKCREELGQIVMPIFYEVEPTDVKRQKEYFGSVFEKTCEGKSVEDIEKWKQALKEVATIAGFDSGDWLVIFICSNHFGTSLYMCSNFS
ncbi:hypothetical protein YC2023_009961 [Brassica napus]